MARIFDRGGFVITDACLNHRTFINQSVHDLLYEVAVFARETSLAAVSDLLSKMTEYRMRTRIDVNSDLLKSVSLLWL